MWREHRPQYFERLIAKRAILFAATLFVFVASPTLGSLIPSYRIIVGFLLDAIGAGILVLHAGRSGTFSQILSCPPLTWLGRLSYSIYLWQQLFLTSYNTTFWGTFPVSLAAILIVAMGSFYLIERPFLKLKHLFDRSHIESFKLKAVT